MIHKKLIIIGLFCLLLATYTNATLTLIKPITDSTTETTVFQGQNANIEITIKNTGNTVETNITPTTDLNAVFNHSGFGLDPGKEKTIIATIYTEESVEGFIGFGEQKFAIKITVLEEKNTLEIIQEKFEQNKDLIYIIMFAAGFGMIALLFRKAK